MKKLVTIITIIFSSTTFAKPPTMALDCAKTKGYKTEAERQYLDAASHGGDMYSIYITFITKRPNDKLVDKVLRDCISTSLKLDDKKDILATAWFRPIEGSNPYDDEQIHAYGDLKFITYRAKTKTVSVESLGLKK